jgi:YbbR domain-containing protein
MKRLFLRNWPLKLLSLCAAFLLWLIFSGAHELTTAITVPIQYRNIPKHLEISSEMVEEAHLVLRGPSARLSRLSGAEIPVIINLGDITTAGQRTFSIHRDNVELPPSVILERALPAQVRLSFEQRITRQAPVHVRFENVPAGQTVEGFVVEPPTLEIFGPRSSVMRIERVEADPVDLSVPQPERGYAVSAYAGDQRVIFTGPALVRVRVKLTSPAANK